MSEGKQQGPLGGSSQWLDGAVELEGTEDMLHVENLLQECGHTVVKDVLHDIKMNLNVCI